MTLNTSNPAINVLKRIRALSQFSDDQLLKLSSVLTIETSKKKQRLIEQNSEAEFGFYLLQGFGCLPLHAMVERTFLMLMIIAMAKYH